MASEVGVLSHRALGQAKAAHARSVAYSSAMPPLPTPLLHRLRRQWISCAALPARASREAAARRICRAVAWPPLPWVHTRGVSHVARGLGARRQSRRSRAFGRCAQRGRARPWRRQRRRCRRHVSESVGADAGTSAARCAIGGARRCDVVCWRVRVGVWVAAGWVGGWVRVRVRVRSRVRRGAGALLSSCPSLPFSPFTRLSLALRPHDAL